jgi:phosphatidate cytidylyltransferase
LLAKRVISALVGIPLLILLIYEGGYFFLVPVILFTLGALYELRSMLLRMNLRPPSLIYFANGVFYPALIFFLPEAGLSLIGLAGLALFLMLHLITMSVNFPRHTLAETAASWLGSSYIGVLTAYFLLLRHQSATGFYLFLYVLILTWAYDTGAYFTGITLGRHFLCPRLSPKKTWEGVAGGLAAAVGAALLFQALHPLFAYGHTVALGLLIGGACQVGDLVESVFKRLADVKDSGTLIPGHGGLLDRCDGLLFSAPAAYFYLKLFLFH